MANGDYHVPVRPHYQMADGRLACGAQHRQGSGTCCRLDPANVRCPDCLEAIRKAEQEATV